MSAQFHDKAKTDPDNEPPSHDPADEDSTDDAATPTQRDRELSALVDGLEERIAAEHEAAEAPGNAAERADAPPMEPDDKAPD